MMPEQKRDTRAGESLQKKEAQEEMPELDYSMDMSKKGRVKLMPEQDQSKEIPKQGCS